MTLAGSLAFRTPARATPVLRSVLYGLALASALACTTRDATLTEPEPTESRERSRDADSSGASSGTEDAPAAEPELERLCAHSYEVLIVPTGMASPGVRRDFVSSCVAGAQTKREALGEVAWAERVGCILAGETPEDLGRCDGREPPPPREAQTQPGSGISYAAVCEHIISIMEQEFGGGLIPAAELPTFIQSCVEQLEQEASDNPQKSERQARCMLEAASIADFERCEE